MLDRRSFAEGLGEIYSVVLRTYPPFSNLLRKPADSVSLLFPVRLMPAFGLAEALDYYLTRQNFRPGHGWSGRRAGLVLKVFSNSNIMESPLPVDVKKLVLDRSR